MATRTTRAASQAHNNNKHENMKIFQKQFQNARRRKHPIPICRHGGVRWYGVGKTSRRKTIYIEFPLSNSASCQKPLKADLTYKVKKLSNYLKRINRFI